MKDEECACEAGEEGGDGGRDNRVNKTGVTPCSPNTAGVGTRAPGDRAEVSTAQGADARQGGPGKGNRCQPLRQRLSQKAQEELGVGS